MHAWRIRYVMKKLDEISTRPDGFHAQFLNSRVDNTVVTNSVADEISLQAKQLDQLRGMIADIRVYIIIIIIFIYLFIYQVTSYHKKKLQLPLGLSPKHQNMQFL